MFTKLKNKMKNKLYYQIFMGIVRHGLTFAGGLLVTNGLADVSTEQTIIGGGIALAGVAWSYFQKRTADKKLIEAQTK